MEKYFEVSSPQGGVYKSKRNTPILTSRGCPAKCCFCASANVWGKRYRLRSPEMVMKEIKLLKKEYNIEEFQIQDDNFTLNKKRIIQICKDLKYMDLHWSMPNGVALWALDEEMIEAMSEAGCHFIIAAIESGNERVLKEVIKKPLKLDRVIDLCKCIKKNRIFLSGFFIVGFPDETLDEIRDTFKFALKCNLDIAGFSYATPLPSTQLWEQAERENLFTNKFDFTNLTYDKPSLKSKNWTIEELEALVISLSRRFYLKTFFKRPKIILFRIIDSFKRDPITLIRIIYYRTMGR
jgi:magnesium-protoporphyrin IX monomethyl ester (oxidative) cyclase